MTKIKICGITNKEDATWALNYGADYIGVNFYKKSPRHVSVSTAKNWTDQLPPFAQIVGIFVDAPAKDVIQAVMKLKLKGIQLHGKESPEYINEIRNLLKEHDPQSFIIKTIKIENEESLKEMTAYQSVADYFLFDSNVPGVPGGTGKRFNWEFAKLGIKNGKPVFLAGGLNLENVKEAIQKVNPFAVDVSSGVEQSPRKKDYEKIRRFIENAKSVQV